MSQQENTNIAVPNAPLLQCYGISGTIPRRTRFNNRFRTRHVHQSEVPTPSITTSSTGLSSTKVIASYRELTGSPPYSDAGLMGSGNAKNRYKSQEEEILNVARKNYRELQLPAEQHRPGNWFWWNRKGEHVFNKELSRSEGNGGPTPQEQLSPDDLRLALLRAGSKEYEEMDSPGLFIERHQTCESRPYHAQAWLFTIQTNPEARKYYWDLMDKACSRLAWTRGGSDTTEPETEGQEEIFFSITTVHRSGNRYANISR